MDARGDALLLIALVQAKDAARAPRARAPLRNLLDLRQLPVLAHLVQWDKRGKMSKKLPKTASELDS